MKIKDHMFAAEVNCELVNSETLTDATGWVLNDQIVYKDSTGAELLGERALKKINSRLWIMPLEIITFIHRHLKVKS